MIKNFLKDENGQGMVEYALIIALIAVVLIGILAALRIGIENIFTDATEALENPGNVTPAK